MTPHIAALAVLSLFPLACYRGPSVHRDAAAHVATPKVVPTPAGNASSTDSPQVACTLVGCQSGADLMLHVPRSPGELTGTKITVCRNGACASAVLPAPFVRPAEPSRPSFAPETQTHLMGPLAEGAAMPVEVSQYSAGWSSIRVRENAADPHADGDLYAADVTDSSGVLVLHADRHVNFEDSFPNGEECDHAPCRTASVDLWPTSRSGLPCTGKRCRSMVTFAGKLIMNSFVDTRIEACRNGECSRVVVDGEIGEWDNFTSRLGGPVYAVFGYGRPGPGTYSLDVEGEPAALKRGDRYRVSVVLPDGSRALEFERKVTYEESFPNGAACDAVPCKSAVIAVDAGSTP